MRTDWFSSYVSICDRIFWVFNVFCKNRELKKKSKYTMSFIGCIYWIQSYKNLASLSIFFHTFSLIAPFSNFSLSFSIIPTYTAEPEIRDLQRSITTYDIRYFSQHVLLCTSTVHEQSANICLQGYLRILWIRNTKSSKKKRLNS